MRIGLISDIHGNAAHLERALDRLQQSVDAILCAGDLVDGADQPEAVINTLKDRQIPCVCGNHDTDKLDDEAKGKHDPALSAASLKYLEDLPFSLDFQYDDYKLRLIHATPWHNGVHVFSYSSRTLLDRMLDQTADADIIVIGHTHEPMAIHYRDRWILNPGSVHLDRFEDRASFAILNTADFQFEVFDIQSGDMLRIPVVHQPNR
jgi:putative phosphoesterase